MNTRTSYMAIAILAVVMTISISTAYALEQACPDCDEADSAEAAMMTLLGESPVTVWTDSSVYDHESMIRIEGTVSTIREGADVGLIITGGPFNNLVTVQQLKVGNDGKFQTSLSTSGELWKYDGTYTIKVTYGTQEITDSKTVELTGGIVSMEPSVSCGAGELAASGQCIPYSISGATVTGARLSVGTTSLIVQIDASDDGMITLEIPRNALDTDSTSDPLFVIVDGEEAESDESATSTTRTVTVMFSAGAEEIEIIGTFAIPEFGTIAAVILAVAIVSIIAVTAKTRLSVLPKY